MGGRGSGRTLELAPDLPRKRTARLTRKEKQDALALHVAGLSSRVIGKRLGMDPKTVQKIARTADTLMKVGAGERAAKLMDVPREELRAQQKQVLMARFRDLTEEACDMLLETIRGRDPGAFRDTAAALEKVDKISGNTVGEAQGGAPAPVFNIDLRGLIDRVLERAEGNSSAAHKVVHQNMQMSHQDMQGAS